MQFPDATDNNEILNCRISADEILRNIKKLNNGKALGLDRILNEHHRVTFYYQSMKHILILYSIQEFSQNNGRLGVFTQFTRIKETG